MTITAAADGSALGNPGPAGWAWYVDDESWAAGGWKHATNNRGELQAVLELFRSTAHVDEDLLVLCDSQYVINSVTKWMPGWKAKGWRKGDGKAVLNLDLLQLLDDAIAGRRYRFEWVKGHANHPLNEAADLRARSAAEAFQRGEPVPAGPGWSRTGVPARSIDSPSQLPTAAPATAPLATSPASAPHSTSRRSTRRRPEEPGLFELAEPPLEREHSVAVRLSGTELAALSESARKAGVTPEEFLRGLL